MTKREWQRRTHQATVLASLGFTPEETETLRRISMTLHRWYELECGTDNGCIERDETTTKPHWTSAYTGSKRPIADRETGAIKRLTRIMDRCNGHRIREAIRSDGTYALLSYYLQTDPRGSSLYILRPGDVPDGADPASYYSRGIVVY